MILIGACCEYHVLVLRVRGWWLLFICIGGDAACMMRPPHEWTVWPYTEGCFLRRFCRDINISENILTTFEDNFIRSQRELHKWRAISIYYVNSHLRNSKIYDKLTKEGRRAEVSTENWWQWLYPTLIVYSTQVNIKISSNLLRTEIATHIFLNSNFQDWWQILVFLFFTDEMMVAHNNIFSSIIDNFDFLMFCSPLFSILSR